MRISAIQKSAFTVILVLTFFISFSSCNKEAGKNSSHLSDRIKPRTIHVVVYENFSMGRAEYFVQELKKWVPDVSIIKKNENLPDKAWYPPRNRYLAIEILRHMNDFTPDTCITLGMTNQDISLMRGTNNWGIMGLSFLNGKSVVISTRRLNQQKLMQQGVKLCLHELGHAEGLPHCPNQSCIMKDAKGKNHFDELTDFCSSCTEHLAEKGWNFCSPS